MAAVRPERLYVGMQVYVLNGRRRCRATVTRLHLVETKQFRLGNFPENSRRGGCDFSDYSGRVHSSLRTYSVDGSPLEPDCSAGHCIHVRYRNNVKAVVPYWSIQLVDPLTQLAEQA